MLMILNPLNNPNQYIRVFPFNAHSLIKDVEWLTPDSFNQLELVAALGDQHQLYIYL